MECVEQDGQSDLKLKQERTESISKTQHTETRDTSTTHTHRHTIIFHCVYSEWHHHNGLMLGWLVYH